MNSDTGMPLISVIVPVYGVEDYVCECIESLTNQTYQNLEILLIDDGSIDGCPRIIDDWARKDPRVRAIHKENGGQSSARNLGMDQARGEYVTFVDGDDWVNPDYCEELLRLARYFDCGISVALFSRARGGKLVPEKEFVAGQLRYACATDQAVRYFMERSIAVWGKMYRSDVLQGLRFPVGRLAEEYVFQLEGLSRCMAVAFSNKRVYNYRIRANSDAHSVKPRYLLDNIKAIVDAYDICKKNFAFEADFCKRHLAALTYEFLAAGSFGEGVMEIEPEIIERSLSIVGGEEMLVEEMQHPTDTLFYTYKQFGLYMTNAERKKVQSDYRQAFPKGCSGGVAGILIKYIPSYLSLELTTRLLGKRS